MVSLVQKLIAELELIIDEFPELFLVDLIVTGVSGKQFVLVLIDSEVGLSIEMCSLISRKLLSKIEEKSLISKLKSNALSFSKSIFFNEDKLLSLINSKLEYNA